MTKGEIADQMLGQIDRYRDGNLSLGALIGDLSFIFESNFDHSDEGARKLWDSIGDLEQVNAMMLDKGESKPDTIGIPIVQNAIKQLEIDLREIKKDAPRSES